MAHPNPFLDGRVHTNDRYNNLANARRNWQIVAGVFGLIAVGSVIDSHYLMHRPPVEAVIVQVDPQGTRLQTYEAGKQELMIPESILISAELTRLIAQAKGMSPDWKYQKHQYENLYQKISGSAESTLTAYYKENSPQEIAQLYTITVQPKSVLQESEQTWQLVWEERKLEKATQKEVSLTTWRAFMTVERRPLTSKKAALENPLGLYVTSLSWAEDKNQ